MIDAKLVRRLAAIGLSVAIVQVAFVSQLPIAGGIADVVPLVVLAVGLLTGPFVGGVFGFAVGLLVDVLLLHTLGLSSLLLLVIGDVAGRVRDARDPEGSFVPLLGAAAATLLWVLGYALIQFLLDVQAPVSGVLARQTLVTMLLNMLVALPVYSLVRSWLIPALPRDPRRRRRQATTTSLSPLHRAR